MVRDTISYAGEVILTIYHKGFDEEVANRRIKKTEKIGKYNLSFEEKVVQDSILDSFKNYDLITGGLLEPGNILNPYGDNACSDMVRYINLEKPRMLFKLKEDKYQLNIKAKYLNHIISFTKKYTGLDLRDHVMGFGDIFIYECHQREVQGKGEEGIIIELDALDDRLIVHFRNDDIIACTKIIDLKGNRSIEVFSDCEWNNCDIQVFTEGKLVFYQQSISFMRTMIFNQTIKSANKQFQLEKLGNLFNIEKVGNVSKSIIGKNPDELKLLISHSDYSIKQRLIEENDNEDKVLFISPHELERARDFIASILCSKCDEIWIYDPYFSDRNGLMVSLDWIRILAYCEASTKHIVFFNNEIKNPIIPDEFVKLSLGDRVIRDSKGVKGSLGINFYQLKTYVHDRFIFAVSKDKVTGITVGTSLNSLDSNYYCIHKLNTGTSRNIFDNLRNQINDTNLVAHASV